MFIWMCGRRVVSALNRNGEGTKRYDKIFKKKDEENAALLEKVEEQAAALEEKRPLEALEAQTQPQLVGASSSLHRARRTGTPM